MNMKLCRRCDIPKLIDDFHWKNKTKSIKHSYCAECQRTIRKEYYKNNRLKELIRLRKSNKIVRRKTSEFIRDYLSKHACVDCGENDPIVLEFDHVRGIKSSNICDMRIGGMATDKIMLEISKCEVRCKNCHARVTYKRSNSFRAKW